ncbi:hypothetical protein PRZ48_008570 [Zasmidium cellare]|uniref:NAD dependent epimerase/dehydratase n=1 Tax=Zasmidium cellare TaxID=395010 RepID=A0ABR0EGJ5_ZASCE|nr:hypothetical protein PRZ48_008570 [Zasmidium cellare]
MGQTPSHPQPNARLQVIAAGLPRTGTTSLSLALSILLNGPVYHAGIQHILSYPDEKPLRRAIKLLERTPYRNASDRQVVEDTLKGLFDSGYVAVADSPYAQFTPELLHLYPHTIVLCTTRPTQPWLHSLSQLLRAGSLATTYKTALVPIARLFPTYTPLLTSTRWKEIYSHPDGSPMEMYEVPERHVEWLKEVVPKERLFFVDVREGWGPICEALGMEVPEGVPFPRVNDGDEVVRIAREFVRRGMVRWAVVGSVLVVLGAVMWGIWWKST